MVNVGKYTSPMDAMGTVTGRGVVTQGIVSIWDASHQKEANN